MARFLDPKNDWAFKQIFASIDHKDILIDFLNSLLKLEEGRLIEDIDFLTPSQAPLYDGRKISILDIVCKDQRGIWYIVEMQVAKTANFLDRVQFYAARTYIGQLGNGVDYAALKSVIVIAILDHIEFKNDPDYTSFHSIRNHKTNEQTLDGFLFYFIELPKFKKKEHELETIEDKWIYFLKHAHDATTIPGNFQGTMVEKACDVLEQYHYTQGQMNEYILAGLARVDFENSLKVATQEAHEIGEEIGEKRGKEIGEKIGKEIGAKENALQNAKMMLIENFPDETILRITKISQAELDELKTP
jgi:predicted transposase/invertase (TIGR01784 family)